MKIQSRILSSIKHRPGSVILRSDVAGFGSASQVSESLKTLRIEGVITRVGVGIYVKSIKDAVTGAITLDAPPEKIVLEIFCKLNIAVCIEHNDALDAANILKLNTGLHRIRRRLLIGGKSIAYVQQRTKKSASSMPLPLRIPKEGVRQFVERLAHQYQVFHKRTNGDKWAEIVTRLSGDEVQSDGTGDLLVALKRAHKLNDREMTALLINHQREMRRV